MNKSDLHESILNSICIYIDDRPYVVVNSYYNQNNDDFMYELYDVTKKEPIGVELDTLVILDRENTLVVITKPEAYKE